MNSARLRQYLSKELKPCKKVTVKSSPGANKTCQIFVEVHQSEESEKRLAKDVRSIITERWFKENPAPENMRLYVIVRDADGRFAR